MAITQALRQPPLFCKFPPSNWSTIETVHFWPSRSWRFLIRDKARDVIITFSCGSYTMIGWFLYKIDLFGLGDRLCLMPRRCRILQHTDIRSFQADVYFCDWGRSDVVGSRRTMINLFKVKCSDSYSVHSFIIFSNYWAWLTLGYCEKPFSVLCAYTSERFGVVAPQHDVLT